jgi:phosphoribosylformylglycinamidine synthase
LARSAHDCSEGGLACALAESALGNGEDPLGVDVTLEDAVPAVPLLFGEAQGRVLLSCEASAVKAVLRLAERHDVPCVRIGTVVEARDRFRIRTRDAGVDLDLEALAGAYFGSLTRIMEGAAETAR